MSTYMTLEEYMATLKVGDEVTIKYYSITGEKEIKEKILKITKSGTIYLRSTNCKDALKFRKNGHWINNFGYRGFITSEYSLKNPYQKPFDFTQVKVYKLFPKYRYKDDILFIITLISVILGILSIGMVCCFITGVSEYLAYLQNPLGATLNYLITGR